ncbi:MAG: VWA domain-containing protein [Myxococcales bacterium]|nr:VWA domain-containing protein [Myxococcales bacterium]
MQLWCVGAVLLGSPAMAQEDDEDVQYSPRMSIDFDVVSVEGSLGATPGGAQDIRFFRDRVADGEVPLPQVFTPEGLFSEHDLPLAEEQRCPRLLCTNAKATDAVLPAQPDVQFMGLVGFTSGLDPDFQRAPLNLVAVIDKSCSMSGEPIETVKAALQAVTHQLRPDDQLSIVLYGSTTHVHLPPSTASNGRKLRDAIADIAIDGSTNMEAGLTLGFDLARRTRRGFDGTSRVMLFTDERPNTGRTDAGSFMGLAHDASVDSIGMTTVGVGVQFGAELAQKVSSVRGGNLFFFSDHADLREQIHSDFDLWVTELAYDLELTVRPAPGLSIAGVYGVPGSLVQWTDDGALQLQVATIFPSKSRGGIAVAFAADDARGKRLRPGDALGRVTLGYEARDGAGDPVTHQLRWSQPSRADVGLSRVIALVDEATTLKKATALHHQSNDQEGAYQLVHALLGRLQSSRDGALEPERDLVRQLDATLARLAGRAGEAPALTTQLDPVTGLPGR